MHALQLKQEKTGYASVEPSTNLNKAKGNSSWAMKSTKQESTHSYLIQSQPRNNLKHT